MKFAVFAAAVLGFVASALAQGLTVNTPVPGVTACEPFLVTWSGGSPPYFLDLLDGNNPNAAPISPLQVNVDVVQFTWKPSFQPGTKFVFQLRDSQGANAKSGIFPVLQGGTTDCLTGSSSASSGAPATSSTGGATVSPGTSSTPSSPGTTTTSASGTATVVAPSSTATVTPGTTPGTSIGAGVSTTSTPGASTTPKTSAPASSASPTPTPGAALPRSVPVVGVLAAAAVALFA